MSRECLFIGGPADGTRMQVEDRDKSIRIPVASSGATWETESEPHVFRGSSRAEYKRVLLLGADNSEHFVFQFGDGDPVAELIAGYTKGKAT
jgi:hypothetical protein